MSLSSNAFPKTPSKSDDKIQRHVDSLAAVWGLELPTRGKEFSPDKLDPNCIGEQILNRMRFLVFRQPALDSAIEEFEKEAKAADVKWIRKPHAENDVLPSRVSAESRLNRDFLKRKDLDVSVRVQLMDSLLHCLDQKKDFVMRDPSYKSLDYTKSPPMISRNSPTPRAKKQTVLTRQWNRMTSSVPEPPMNVSHLASQPPSDEFPPEFDISELTEDLIMADASSTLLKNAPKVKSNYAAAAKKGAIEDEEIFETPPSSSSHCLTCSYELLGDGEGNVCTESNFLYFQTLDLVSIPLAVQSGKKRPYPEAMKPPSSSRKATRARPIIPPQSCNVDHLSFIDAPVKPEGINYPPFLKHKSFSQVPSSTPNGLYMGNSFDSSTSFASFTRVPSLTSSMTTQSTTWTPNSSFHMDSAATSFTSAVDQMELSESSSHLHSTPLEDYATSDSAARSIPKALRSKRSDVGLKNSHLNVTSDSHTLNERVDLGSPEIFHPKLGQFTSRADQSKNSINHDADNDPLKYPASLISLAPQAKFFVQDEEGKISKPICFRQLHEVTRVSIFSKVPLDAFSECLNKNINDYNELWKELEATIKKHGLSLPDRSSLEAWERALKDYDGVSLTGDLKYAEKMGGHVFDYAPNPLKLERSHRLARKFGGDRFCVVGMPDISNGNFPGHLKSDPIAVRKRVINQLVDTDFHFSGRVWRAYYVKPEPRKKKAQKAKSKSPNDIKCRVFFFATDGHDLPATEHGAMSIEKLLEWFMPARRNEEQPCLKFFARLALAVSGTVSTVVFRPCEIIRTCDARADAPQKRRLKIGRERKSKSRNTSDIEASVMNDGCARISKAAAQAIADYLSLDRVPSAFQGRIGGAKGVWMIDAIGETLTNSKRGFWIEVTDSQLKFEGHEADIFFPDEARLTFEVNSYSNKLSSAILNFQLLPILANGGVPEKVFERLLEEDLTDKIGQLEVAMESGLTIGKWNQDKYWAAGDRARSKDVEMQGGIPLSKTEKINWLVEHGFNAKNCRYLKDSLFNLIKDYCMRLETKMSIEVGKSTSAFMIADPLALLEENEIHLGFSTPFYDSKSKWEDTMLHDVDVLVARLPALLPSDIQKVRAVFKPELRMYKDVVVFSSKGKCSLAEKLSGGDYDGDRAWICWEPNLVDPFENSPVPLCPPLKFYGIEKDKLKVKDIISDINYISVFLRHGFNFQFRSNLLGSCTLYHEALGYHRKRIDEEDTMILGSLLGLLVDALKAGLCFGEKEWMALLNKLKLSKRFPKPAYKDKDNAKPTNHIIDNLVFKIAKGVRVDTLGKFSKHFAHVQSWDDDLVRFSTREDDHKQDDQVLKTVLADLQERFKGIAHYWGANTCIPDNNEVHEPRKPNPISFSAVVEKCRADFLAIKPSCLGQEVNISLLIKRLDNNYGDALGMWGHWRLLKASAFFRKYHEWSMVWHVAGAELAELKATAGGFGTYRIVAGSIYPAMKLDGKLVDSNKKRLTLRNEEGDREEEEYEWGGED